MAFQAWNGLQRDGIAGPQTLAALQTATVPTPRSTGSGRRVEVYRDLGVVLLVEGSAVVRSVHASTGRPGFETPAGAFKADPASHGCVRLPAPEAQRVYEFVSVGTPVIVY